MIEQYKVIEIKRSAPDGSLPFAARLQNTMNELYAQGYGVMDTCIGRDNAVLVFNRQEWMQP